MWFLFSSRLPFLGSRVGHATSCAGVKVNAPRLIYFLFYFFGFSRSPLLSLSLMPFQLKQQQQQKKPINDAISQLQNKKKSVLIIIISSGLSPPSDPRSSINFPAPPPLLCICIRDTLYGNDLYFDLPFSVPSLL